MKIRTLKFSPIFLLTILLSLNAWAGFDFTVGPASVSLKTNDGLGVPNAEFSFTVFAQRKSIPCFDDMHVVGSSCWKSVALKSGKAVTGADGVAQIPPMQFQSSSEAEKRGDDPSRELMVSGWAVHTPFQDAQGNDRVCVSLSPYDLQSARIDVSGTDHVVIDASQDKVQALVSAQVEKCMKKAANLPASVRTILPY